MRARYRAEARFRLYGALAIGLTALFLLVLIVDILAKGCRRSGTIPSCSRCPSPPEVDPEGKRSNETLRAADYFGLARQALYAAVPGIESRQARRELADILSTGAADDLRNSACSPIPRSSARPSRRGSCCPTTPTSTSRVGEPTS